MTTSLVPILLYSRTMNECVCCVVVACDMAEKKLMESAANFAKLLGYLRRDKLETDNYQILRDESSGVLEKSRMAIRELSEKCSIICGSVQCILDEDLGMRRVSAKYMPKLLSADQKEQWSFRLISLNVQKMSKTF
ncbi:hypothetical protein AVEN_170288-1 [Araneus ventricosus]|uniref:Uncharacterized protein n=1 Tax=Araneus ventricosus TaxID=182803 RepID=A0A4Y2WPW6_ARAVE|nr:hypothetical protein AVEN_33114-1 [Araneus ventricosus]GBO39543.1 hypothetical protein AVEN_170288-1 [Araneus ventricosus]